MRTFDFYFLSLVYYNDKTIDIKQITDIKFYTCGQDLI